MASSHGLSGSGIGDNLNVRRSTFIQLGQAKVLQQVEGGSGIPQVIVIDSGTVRWALATLW